MIQTYNLPTGQKRTLDFIVGFIKEKGQSPTLREISEGLDIAVQTVDGSLSALELKNFITREPRQHRSITVKPELLEEPNGK